MEIFKNGGPPKAGIITSSWVRDDFTTDRRRYKIFAMHVPVESMDPQGVNPQHPRLAGGPTVIGEMEITVPNLDVAKFLLNAFGEMLSKQGPEIITVQSK